MSAAQAPDGALPDDTLLAAVARGEGWALSALFDRYAGVVYGVGLRILGNPELAEDVVQETFWRVWRRGATYERGRGQVSGWLLGIARNLAIDELRRQQARPTPIYDDESRSVLGALSDPRATDEAVLADERQRVVRAALERIPPDQRRVLELAYFGGLSQREIADQLQSPVGTVKTRARLGLLKLRDLLAAQGLQPEDFSA